MYIYYYYEKKTVSKIYIMQNKTTYLQNYFAEHFFNEF